jgi:hypothetical protein
MGSRAAESTAKARRVRSRPCRRKLIFEEDDESDYEDDPDVIFAAIAFLV